MCSGFEMQQYLQLLYIYTEDTKSLYNLTTYEMKIFQGRRI